MGSYLADALGKKSDELNRIVAELENVSGNPSEDVRLASELIAQTRQKIALLGLDPNDTTAEELYEALNFSFVSQREAFDRSVDNHSISQTVTGLFSHFETQGVWTPKSSYLKKELVEHPPKKLMKALHYRTVDSMMKRENPAKIAAAAGVCESANWVSAFEKRINKIAASDWQIGPINILLFEKTPWSELPGDKTIQTSCVAGSVILRTNLAADTDSFYLILSLVQSVETLIAQSRATALRLLGGPSAHGYDNDYAPRAKIGELSLSLSAYELHPDELLNEADSADEINQGTAIGLWQQFYRVHPALTWWKDSEHLVFVDKAGEAVSLNLLDVAKNATDGLIFPQRKLDNAQIKLEDKLANRYASQTPAGMVREKNDISELSPQEKLSRLQMRYAAPLAIGSVS